MSLTEMVAGSGPTQPFDRLTRLAAVARAAVAAAAESSGHEVGVVILKDGAMYGTVAFGFPDDDAIAAFLQRFVEVSSASGRAYRIVSPSLAE
jgi:hypothetical protein